MPTSTTSRTESNAEADPNADSHDIHAGNGRSSPTLARLLDGSLQGSYTEIAVHGRVEADGPLSARELADQLPRTRMSVHRALRELREAGLVERSLGSGSDGRRTVYVLNDGT
jgi:predicted transcriptional regulator